MTPIRSQVSTPLCNTCGVEERRGWWFMKNAITCGSVVFTIITCSPKPFFQLEFVGIRPFLSDLLPSSSTSVSPPNSRLRTYSISPSLSVQAAVKSGINPNRQAEWPRVLCLFPEIMTELRNINPTPRSSEQFSCFACGSKKSFRGRASPKTAGRLQNTIHSRYYDMTQSTDNRTP